MMDRDIKGLFYRDWGECKKSANNGCFTSETGFKDAEFTQTSHSAGVVSSDVGNSVCGGEFVIDGDRLGPGVSLESFSCVAGLVDGDGFDPSEFSTELFLGFEITR